MAESQLQQLGGYFEGMQKKIKAYIKSVAANIAATVALAESMKGARELRELALGNASASLA